MTLTLAGPSPNFGRSGIIHFVEGLDRDTVKPGKIGSSAPAVVIRNTSFVGASLQAGTVPVSKTNASGYVRGFDVRTSKKLWTFRPIPRPGGTGNEDLGYVYLPVGTTPRPIQAFITISGTWMSQPRRFSPTST